ncbi:MAG TPA: helix-turn-helix transcriptional regulator [Jiangellales bacterium]|nr:helix-turn-helix transcriptional regulator [Jiangellales bacterium]
MSFDPTPTSALARRLHGLRTRQWPRHRVTQRVLADALGGLSTSTISSYENGSIVPPDERLHDYATFFATPRSFTEGGPGLLPEDGLSEAERVQRKELYEELLSLRGTDGTEQQVGSASGAARRTWRFPDRVPVRVICGDLPEKDRSPLAHPSSLNYTELRSFADLDALVELFGHLRMENPHSDVRYRRSGNLERLVADDISGHLVLLGADWNEATEWVVLRQDLPVSQVRDPAVGDGLVFEVTEGGKEQRFLPVVSQRLGLVEDVGLIYRMPNPHNTAYSLTIVSGVYSRGVLGAVRCLTDARLRDRNEAYLANRFGDAPEFGVLVRVPVLGGSAVTPDLTNPGIRLREWPPST